MLAKLLFLLLFDRCVVSNPIVNGFSRPIEPPAGQFPFHSNLLQLKSISPRSYFSFCGGSLIHPQFVLTAAHCIQLDENSPILKINQTFVALGSIYRSGQNAQILSIARHFIHPQYFSSGGHNDIGIIQLKSAAKLGANVKPIRLHQAPNENLIGKTAYLTGFGIINDLYQTPIKLREAILHIAPASKCFENDVQTNSKELCATSTIAEGKACKGDSGGPLFLLHNNSTPIQIGITSHLALLPLCRIGFNHSVYTKVSGYLDWIRKITGGGLNSK